MFRARWMSASLACQSRAHSHGHGHVKHHTWVPGARAQSAYQFHRHGLRFLERRPLGFQRFSVLLGRHQNPPRSAHTSVHERGVHTGTFARSRSSDSLYACSCSSLRRRSSSRATRCATMRPTCSAPAAMAARTFVSSSLLLAGPVRGGVVQGNKGGHDPGHNTRGDAHAPS